MIKNSEEVFNFFHSDPYSLKDDFYFLLESYQKKLNFPALTFEVGSLLYFLIENLQSKYILELGSGYGHSAYWSLKSSYVKKIILTEKKKELYDLFLEIPFPRKNILEYHLTSIDSFLEQEDLSSISFVLVDGAKHKYLSWIQILEQKLPLNAVILIDNALSSKAFSEGFLKKLHHYLKESSFTKIFLPLNDGVTLLRKTSS